MHGILKKMVWWLFKAVLVGEVLLLSGCQKEAREGFRELASEEGKEADDKEVSEELTKESDKEAEAAREEASGDEMIVYVCGEVKNPGVYVLDKSGRVCDALRAAGGMTEDAAEAYLNQARRLNDGERVYVPSKEEAEQLKLQEEQEAVSGSGKAFDGVSGEEGSGKISINRAGREALLTLPGIGGTKADAILDYREKHGGFSSLEELMQVEGIKEGTYNKLKDKIEL